VKNPKVCGMTKPKTDLKAPLNHHMVQGTLVQVLLPVAGKETAEIINNESNDPLIKAPGIRRFLLFNPN
jgi:hypothetical protein